MKIVTRRMFLKKAGMAAVTMAFAGMVSAEQAKTEKPSFIFIFADDLGWGDLHCYGHERIKTPNLDKLAKQGTLFSQFYVNSAVCSPSRTAVMTSHFPARHGIHGHLDSEQHNKNRGMPNYVDPKVHTLTNILKGGGYVTGHFGKWHLGQSKDAPEPSAYGIDDYRILVGNGPSWDQSDPYFMSKSTEMIVDETIRFVEKNKDKRFYVNLWTMEPHGILNPPEALMEAYKKLGSPSPADENHKGALQVYYTAVSNVDNHIGRLLKRLDELGLSKNTVVMFSSDNWPEDIHFPYSSHSGVGSAGPFRGRKRSLYEGGIRVPFIVRWPAGGIRAGKVDGENIVSAVDLLPTICSMASAELPKDFYSDGQDMSAALRGQIVKRNKPLMWEWRFAIIGDTINQSPMLAIREGKWKLLMNPDESRIELYDISSDPMEVDNKADQHRDVVKTLSSTVLKWQKTLPKPNASSIGGKNDYRWPRNSK